MLTNELKRIYAPSSTGGAAATEEIPLTSEIPFFSSLHGRERRNLRGIDRRDLQAAVKHGTREPGWPNPATGESRWKYTWAGIVYITDASSTREVTSYAEPLDIPLAQLTQQDLIKHEAAKHRLKEEPSLCTSHTVIVVDQSGSMNTSDVFDFRTRSQAVFGMLAQDFVAKQRLSGEATVTDVVSLVLMNDYASLAFELEPMGLVLYNKLVELHDHATPRSHGNFLPALTLAESLLRRNCHGDCALSLLFLSDGRPSDETESWHAFGRPRAEVIAEHVANLSDIFGQQLSVSTLGFANRDQDFSVLKKMADSAREMGADAQFHRPELTSDGLGAAIAHTVSSLTATRTRLTLLATDGRGGRALRQVQREAASSSWGHPPVRKFTDAAEGCRDSNWIVHASNVKRLKFSRRLDERRNIDPWIRTTMVSEGADCIAIRTKALGEGAERVVYGLQELESDSWSFVGPKMVAKESKLIGDEFEKIGFHTKFVKTQMTAKRFASKFNNQVRRRLFLLTRDQRSAARVWEVTFLNCHVYVFTVQNANERSTHEMGVLAEKLLEPANRYTKWNGNQGYVSGREAGLDRPISGAGDAQIRQARATEMMMAGIEEGDEEESSDDDSPSSTSDVEEEVSAASLRGGGDSDRRETLERVAAGGRWVRPAFRFNPTPECYLQAFSHYTYRYSQRTMLVCDLQGVMSENVGDKKGCHGVFELTDPVIHHRTTDGRDGQVYGKTDFGVKGMHKFFETHLCNDVCVLLGLSKHNRCGN